jgi:hypothetical protein
VLPDAQVVAGLQVDQAKNSLFGQYVLSHLSVNDTKLEQFTSETGFDPRHDVNEIIVASNWKQNTPDNQWMVAAHGTFNISKITATAQANGGAIVSYQATSHPSKPPLSARRAMLPLTAPCWRKRRVSVPARIFGSSRWSRFRILRLLCPMQT